LVRSHRPDLLDVAAVVAGGQIREGLTPRSSAGAEVGDEQRRPEVSEVDGGVGVDPLCTEVGEGRAGMDPAGMHGAGTETAPRVRVGRSSREVSRAWTGWPPHLSLAGSRGGGGKEVAGAEEGEGRSGGEEREPNPQGRALLVPTSSSSILAATEAEPP